MLRVRPLLLVTALSGSLAVGCVDEASKALAVTASVTSKVVEVTGQRSPPGGARKVATSPRAVDLPFAGGCGLCPEPENGHALCFLSTCEVRCDGGFELDHGGCVPHTKGR